MAENSVNDNPPPYNPESNGNQQTMGPSAETQGLSAQPQVAKGSDLPPAYAPPQGAYAPPQGAYQQPQQGPYAPPQGAYQQPPTSHQAPSNYDQKGTPFPQQCPTNYGATTIVTQQPTFVAGTTTIIPIFAEQPVRTQCPNCHQHITTNVQSTPGTQSWLLCAILFFFGFWLCCWIPLVVDSMKDIHHNCPSCGALIGTCKRM